MENHTKTECCPEFKPEPWDEKFLNWENKKFIKASVCTFFYIPINFGKVIVKLMNIAEKSNAVIPEWLCLSEHTSKWNMNLLLAVEKEIADIENVTLTGKFLSKVYEGDFKNTNKWMKDFETFADSKKFSINKIYLWYTTCPKCAKKFGKNYVVLIASEK